MPRHEIPTKERALLAASLWESLDDPYSRAAGRSEEEAIALALARDEEIEAGTVPTLTHADLMKRPRS